MELLASSSDNSWLPLQKPRIGDWIPVNNEGGTFFLSPGPLLTLTKESQELPEEEAMELHA